jgi:hypothetical protein
LLSLFLTKKDALDEDMEDNQDNMGQQANSEEGEMFEDDSIQGFFDHTGDKRYTFRI